MSEKMNESLSALMDGEADELELRRTLNEISEKEELRSRWERYHLISAVMKREPQVDHSRIKAGIWAELDLADDSYSDDILVSSNSTQESGVRSWGGTLGKITVAATVALAVVFSVDLGTDSNLDSGQPAQLVAEGSSNELVLHLDPGNETSLPQTLLVADTVAANGTPIVREANINSMSKHPTLEDMRRANAYQLRHVQSTAINKHPSMVPFVKMASFENK